MASSGRSGVGDGAGVSLAVSVAEGGGGVALGDNDPVILQAIVAATPNRIESWAAFIVPPLRVHALGSWDLLWSAGERV
jgi:hypothetical protein